MDTDERIINGVSRKGGAPGIPRRRQTPALQTSSAPRKKVRFESRSCEEKDQRYAHLSKSQSFEIMRKDDDSEPNVGSENASAYMRSATKGMGENGERDMAFPGLSKDRQCTRRCSSRSKSFHRRNSSSIFDAKDYAKVDLAPSATLHVSPDKSDPDVVESVPLPMINANITAALVEQNRLQPIYYKSDLVEAGRQREKRRHSSHVSARRRKSRHPMNMMPKVYPAGFESSADMFVCAGHEVTKSRVHPPGLRDQGPAVRVSRRVVSALHTLFRRTLGSCFSCALGSD